MSATDPPGVVVRAIFALNLTMTLLAVGACLRHARRTGPEPVALLGTAAVYGVALEQLVILRFDAYRYPVEDYLLTVGDVPIVIGLGWAAILYAGRHVGRRFGLSGAGLAAFAGLFALHVDLAIDAVAIRVPFWQWTPAGAWFGVIVGNFLGWFLVAALFTAAWDGLRERDLPLAAVAPATLVLALAGLIAGLEAWLAVATTVPRKAAILTGIVAAATALVVRDGIDPVPVAPGPAAVPFLFHGFYLGVALSLGLHRTRPAIVAVGLAMLAVGAAVHAPALSRRRESVAE